jgi:hypothetical protein
MPDQPKDTTAETNLDLSVLGYSGLKQSGGVIDEEFHPKLRGTFGPKVYREMSDNSSTVGAVRFVIKALVRQVEWRIEPADSSKEAEEWAEFVENCLTDMSHTFEDFIAEVLSFLDYGWSYFEIVYKLRKGSTDDPTTSSQFDDGKVGWRKFGLRPQDTLERWEFDPEDSGLRGMWQTDMFSGKRAFIPIEKAVLFRTETMKNNPEGRSIYRNAVVDYFYLKRICEIEAIGIERDMTGLLTMEVPMDLLNPNATPAQKALRATLEKMLSELKRDEREYALIPPEMDRQNKPTGFKLKLLTSGGRRQIDTPAVKNYYKANILQAALAQFIQLGLQGTGSFALANSQTDLFSVALGMYLDTIAATFNRFAIDRLMELNAVPFELRPYLSHGDIETPPLAEIGAYVQALAASGQLPTGDKPLQRKLLSFARLPEPEETNEPEGAPAVPAPPQGEVQKGLRVKKFSKRVSIRRNLAGPLKQRQLPFA